MMESDIITYTFALNIITIFIFAIIYSLIPVSNFQPLNPKDKLTFIDYLFYSVTIQSSVGLPDITALSDLAKILALIQQLILMSSAFILLKVFYYRK